MTGTRHVAVIGGGVIGLSCAHYLLDRGHRVTVVERGGPDHDCCSLGNAGFISPSHFVPLAAPGMVEKAFRWMWNPESPFYVRPRIDPEFFAWGWHFWRASSPARVRRAEPVLRDLALASRDLFIDLAEGTGNEFGLVREGLLLLFRTEKALEAETRVAARCRELGMPAEVLDARGVAALEPGVTFDVIAGVKYPLDAHLVPQRLVATLTRLVKERGATFVWNTEVGGFSRDGQRVGAVVTPQGTIDADEFVLAAGSWSPQLARRIGLRLPLEPGKGYSLTIEKPREMPRRSIILHEARVAITPMGGALRVGGTMEFAGIDLRINPPRVRGILKSLARYLPSFRPEDFASTTPWCGLRPVTPDGLPYVGRLLKNLTIATGHAMMGVSLAPITGKLVSEIVSGETPRIDIAALRPDRFG